MKQLFAALAIVTMACGGEQTATPPPPAATHPAAPAAATIVDPHSFARPAEARVEHISLDLNVDFPTKRLSGTAALRIQRQPSASKLILDTNGLTIRSVTLQPGGRAAAFTFGAPDAIRGRALEIPLQPDTSTVVVDYQTDPGAKALQWLEPSMTAGKKLPFLLSQSEAILARTWVPCQDTPSVRFTYDATLHVPKGLVAVMSAAGNPQKSDPSGVYHFDMPQAIPSYLLAIAVGDIAFRPLDGRSGVYAEPSVVDAAAREFVDIPKMMSAAEALYGPYRWGRYDVLILPPSFPYGGMENPRLTFATPTVIAGDRSLVSLVAHELAHSWSGNLVTNATWSDSWLNEGVTTYIEHRIDEQLYGREYSEMLWQLGLADVKRELATLPPSDQGLYIDLTGRDPDDAPGIIYEKGALFLRMLEEATGRARWDSFLRGYFEKFAFQPMTTAKFEEYLKASLPDVVKKADVDAWLHGPGLPANCPQPHSDRFAHVEEQAAAFAGGTSPASLQTAGWSSHEWVHFIESLPALTPVQMGALDTQFHFSDSGNSEILFAWLQKSIDARYKGAYPAVERFLTSQGRRRFLEPLYRKLVHNGGDDVAFAKQIYTKARPGYHPLAQGTIDGIVKPAGK